jgi:hypothetical protein
MECAYYELEQFQKGSSMEEHVHPALLLFMFVRNGQTKATRKISARRDRNQRRLNRATVKNSLS